MMKTENQKGGAIHVQNYEIGSISYAEKAAMEKIAFNIPVDPVAVASALAGGYTANHVYNKKQGEIQQKQQMMAQRPKRIEMNDYTQVEQILNDLKIMFTPINVIYSVNGQPFEMINADEMTPQMKKSFMMRDSQFFREFLINKMKMEMQLAHQMFATRLLETQEKFASFVVLDEAEKNGFDKVAYEKQFEGKQLTIPVSFDNIRPFTNNPPFMTEKIAGLFSQERRDILTTDDLDRKTTVGFLPDRVLFMVNGQMIEQLPLRGMNEEGYNAFRTQNKPFFIDWFTNQAKIVHNSTMQEVLNGELEMDKQASTLREVIDEKAALVQGDFEKETYRWFLDHDVHPIVYLHYLEKKVGQEWYTFDIEAIISTIEEDMGTQVADIPFNKITALKTIYDDRHAMFFSSFTYEKFARTMAGRSIDFEEQEPGLTLGEMLFANEIAKFVEGDDVYAQFVDQVAQYFSYEVVDEDVRSVSSSLYESDSRFADEFYEKVNGFLNRQWFDKDTQSINDITTFARIHKQTEIVANASKMILDKYAEFIDFENVDNSIQEIVSENEMLLGVDTDAKQSYMSALIKNVQANIDAAVYLETQRDLLEHQLELWKG